MKFYAVKKGRTPGIFRTWEEAKKQVSGYPKAEYKSFTKITDATAYLHWNAASQSQILQKDQKRLRKATEKIARPAASRSKYFAEIFTDGGSRNTGVYRGGHVKKTDKAAWAYQICWDDHEVHAAGGEKGASNNKMEQTALIMALRKLLNLGFNQQKLHFVLDSRYVLNAINRGWLQSWQKRGWRRSGGPLANKEEWQEIARLLPSFPHAVFSWTKGHAGNRGNEFVDHLLNRYMDEKES